MEMEMEMEMEENLLNSLPFEIKLAILSWLPVESVLACRRVCKAWNNAFLDLQKYTYFAYLHLRCNGGGLLDQKPQQLSSESKMLNFVFIKRHNLYYAEYLTQEKDGKQQQNFHKRMINLSIPLDVTGYVGSCNGLICLSSNSSGKTSEPSYICNPITRELVYLPRIAKEKYDGISFVHGFGYHPLTDKYKVVRVSYAYNNKLKPYDPASRSGRMYRSYSRGQVAVYTLGSGKGWTNLEETSYRVLSNNADHAVGSVCVNGALHWLCNGAKDIVAFNLADEKFCSLPTLPGLSPHSTQSLCVSNGFLCLVCKNSSEGSAGIWFLKRICREIPVLLVTKKSATRRRQLE
ncbi:F-box protein At3g07870-like [Papaver somniferum]|uniref:F-box protein At3g07870-like n=1 Tax=Papaver somniferum TaxID=3469 RepID=UPI000E6FEAF8|nr:F-box protein At3g07870-like [Papaver somniferum]